MCDKKTPLDVKRENDGKRRNKRKRDKDKTDTLK